MYNKPHSKKFNKEMIAPLCNYCIRTKECVSFKEFALIRILLNANKLFSFFGTIEYFFKTCLF